LGDVREDISRIIARVVLVPYGGAVAVMQLGGERVILAVVVDLQENAAKSNRPQTVRSRADNSFYWPTQPTV